MSTLDVNGIMDGLGTRLATIAGLRVYDYPAEVAAPPAAIVGLPTAVDYDWTKGRGSDRVVVPVVVLVGKVSDRASRDALSLYAAGSGSKSVKTAIEADVDLGNAAQTCRVQTTRIEVVTLNGIDYLGATFDCEVIS
jgi:hypothetical protein